MLVYSSPEHRQRDQECLAAMLEHRRRFAEDRQALRRTLALQIAGKRMSVDGKELTEEMLQAELDAINRIMTEFDSLIALFAEDIGLAPTPGAQ